jgi:hypothetical protein
LLRHLWGEPHCFPLSQVHPERPDLLSCCSIDYYDKIEPTTSDQCWVMSGRESTKVKQKEVTLDAPEHKARTFLKPATIPSANSWPKSHRCLQHHTAASESRCGVMVDLAGWLTLGTESGHSKSEMQIQVPRSSGPTASLPRKNQLCRIEIVASASAGHL